VRLNRAFIVRVAAGAVVLVGLAVAVPAATSHAAVSDPSRPSAVAAGLFLQVSGAPGESTARGHAGWIAVSSYSTSLAVDPVNGPQWGPLQVTLPYSKAVPPLEAEAGTGLPIPAVELQAAETDGAGRVTNYLTITLTNATLASVTESSTGDRPHVVITFKAQKACEVYVPPGPGETGAATGAEQVCFTPVDRG